MTATSSPVGPWTRDAPALATVAAVTGGGAEGGCAVGAAAVRSGRFSDTSALRAPILGGGKARANCGRFVAGAGFSAGLAASSGAGFASGSATGC